MDGAAAEFCGGGSCPSDFAFHYVDNSNGILNPYLSLVKQHGWANYMFQTNQGPSFPAHQFLFGGTSAPTAADDTQAIFASDNVVNSSNLSNLNAGCLAPAGTTVAVISPSGPLTPIYPCFEHSTLADLLDPQGVTWRYYAPSAGSIWTAPNAIGHICMSTGPGGRCTSTDWKQNVDLNSADVLTDISNCKLQQVSWVIPTGNNSDHAGQNNGGGPSWVNAIVNAIGAATSCDNGAGYWQDTAIFITWDDWGGWYDHEPPPTVSGIQGDYQLGFRVPLIVVSAYTPAGFISNNKYDFGSILNYIEKNFLNQRGALTFADARALGDLSDFFTLSPMSAKKFQKVKAPKSASFFLHDKSPQTDPDDE